MFNYCFHPSPLLLELALGRRPGAACSWHMACVAARLCNTRDGRACMAAFTLSSVMRSDQRRPYWRRRRPSPRSVQVWLRVAGWRPAPAPALPWRFPGAVPGGAGSGAAAASARPLLRACARPRGAAARASSGTCSAASCWHARAPRDQLPWMVRLRARPWQKSSSRPESSLRERLVASCTELSSRRTRHTVVPMQQCVRLGPT